MPIPAKTSGVPFEVDPWCWGLQREKSPSYIINHVGLNCIVGVHFQPVGIHQEADLRCKALFPSVVKYWRSSIQFECWNMDFWSVWSSRPPCTASRSTADRLRTRFSGDFV